MDRRDQHQRLARRLQEEMRRLGGTMEIYEQVGPNYSLADEQTGRFVQIMKFRDRRHLTQIQTAERADYVYQQLIAEFCSLIDVNSQIQNGSFLRGHYIGTSGTAEEAPPVS